MKLWLGINFLNRSFNNDVAVRFFCRVSQLSKTFLSATAYDSNLVDPASSHTLVSKIKPCMCKYKQIYTVKLRTAHYISYSLFDNTLLLG